MKNIGYLEFSVFNTSHFSSPTSYVPYSMLMVMSSTDLSITRSGDTLTELQHRLATLQASLNRVILGKPEVIELMLVALLAEGHILLEDIPGIGKTTLAKAFARTLECVLCSVYR